MTRQSTESPEDHLRRADPVLAEVIDEAASRGGSRPSVPPDPSQEHDPNLPTDRYGVLVRAIISQNISGGASRSIYQRLKDRFGGRSPTPRQILDDDPEEMRTAAGLSRAKTASLRSLAEHVSSGELDLERLHELPDDEVVSQLDQVKGIGTWTADMFLMFHLNRPDVLPVGDLGLRRAVEKAYELPTLPDPDVLERIAEPWRPYRTLACIYLWGTAQTTPQV
ncbi:DNA-3-methyladenine glycosylase family protein [Streptomyces sp. NBC_01198]|uniref:DNA-3-methyladenine glycosylase family protein n=1 Tax=Streptomyces sp. NBC_01198 TaxID=2903769 RepID=UPI002E0F9EA3|nr:DNA-3-methyladenine glycosylase [Streptomyces sp. NBC_01198]